jgi:hypothetical protein
MELKYIWNEDFYGAHNSTIMVMSCITLTATVTIYAAYISKR